MFLTRREPGVPLSLFRSYPLPFSPAFLLYCSLPFLFLCLFHWSISAVVSGEAFYLLFSPAVAICSDPQGTWSALVSFPILSSSLFSSFSSIEFLNYSSFSSMSFSLTYICCSFRGGILSVVFRTVATCSWPAGNLECPCLFSDRILFPFLLLLFYIVSCPSFSSMSFSLIYICCSLILFPFLLLFFYIVPYPSFSSMSFFHWSTSAVVSGEAFYLLFSLL